MATRVASCPAPPPPSSPPPALDDYVLVEEPEIYISTAHLVLKRTQDTEPAKELYEWHTTVVLPAEPTSVQEEASVKQSRQPVEAINRNSSAPKNKNLYTPASTYGGTHPPGGLATTVMDFMNVERYHSERNMLANATATKEVETTDV